MSSDWPADGVRVAPGDTFDDRTRQTPARAAAVGARTGAAGLGAGTFTIAPGASTGAHHHGCSTGTLRHTGPQAGRAVGHDEQALEA